MLHTGLDAGADVQHEPAALFDGAGARVDDVVDVDEVPGLLAAPEDGHRLAASDATGEDGHHHHSHPHSHG